MLWDRSLSIRNTVTLLLVRRTDRPIQHISVSLPNRRNNLLHVSATRANSPLGPALWHGSAGAPANNIYESNMACVSLASAGFIWRCARLWSLMCVWWSQYRPCDWFKGQQMTLQSKMWPNERLLRWTAKHTSHMYVKEDDTQAQPQTLACLKMSESVICNECRYRRLVQQKLCASASYFLWCWIELFMAVLLLLTKTRTKTTTITNSFH